MRISDWSSDVCSSDLPMAFAQTAPTTDDGMQPTSPQATAPTAEPKQVTWADLDVDKDGSLTQAEVATVPALTQVFDAADAHADGQLTAEEYKAHPAAASGEAAAASRQSTESPRAGEEGEL